VRAPNQQRWASLGVLRCDFCPKYREAPSGQHLLKGPFFGKVNIGARARDNIVISNEPKNPMQKKANQNSPMPAQTFGPRPASQKIFRALRHKKHTFPTLHSEASISSKLSVHAFKIDHFRAPDGLKMHLTVEAKIAKIRYTKGGVSIQYCTSALETLENLAFPIDFQ